MKMFNYISSPLIIFWKLGGVQQRSCPLKQNTLQSLIFSSLKRYESQEQLSVTASRNIPQCLIKTKWYYPIFFQGRKYREVVRFHWMVLFFQKNLSLVFHISSCCVSHQDPFSQFCYDWCSQYKTIIGFSVFHVTLSPPTPRYDCWACLWQILLSRHHNARNILGSNPCFKIEKSSNIFL